VRLVLLLMIAFIAGCHPMPRGDLSRVKHSDVILLRGWRDLYSDGINQLATELQADGYHPAVYGESQWSAVADSIISGGGESPVLVGFSYGADHAIDVARKLNERHIPVALLITIDPVTPPKVPANVAVCHNLYQSDFWDFLPWFRGIPLKADSQATRLTNINVHDRPDLDDPHMAHKTIAGYPQIHREILLQIRNQLPRAKM
jgi:pimeloyl-ACP methyl ester carboxylesterase